MSYRVEELASRANRSVAAVRYYQRLGLLAPPKQSGRVALYEEEHLLRLREIRRLAELGLSLEQIKAVFSGDDLLAAILLEQAGGVEMITKQELLENSGLPAEIVELAISFGLLRATEGEGEEKFPRMALEMLESAVSLLKEGADQSALTDLALKHAEHTEAAVAEAIELFRRTIPPAAGREQLAALLQRVLPQVLRLVTCHFHLTLLRQVSERAQHTPADRDTASSSSSASSSSAAGAQQPPAPQNP